jgi:hypothetical protein
MKKRTLATMIAALAAVLLLAPLALAGASISASASVNVNLKAAPGGAYLVGRPPVPVVRPHRITMGLHHGGVYRTRVFGLSPTRVVYAGARARPYVLVGAPVAVIAAPGVVVQQPGVVVQQPGVVVQQPGVVVGVQAPGVVVAPPVVAVGVGVPGVVVGAPVGVVHHTRVVAPSPVVVVRDKHFKGKGKGHFKGHKRGKGR